MSILFGLMLTFSTPAGATEAMVSIVREMLLLEAEQARQNMSSCSRPAEGESHHRDAIQSPPPKLVNMPRLKAIYGRDTQLLAEVQHEQRLLVFQQGQRWPIGRERDQNIRLLSLNSRCIELEMEAPPQQAQAIKLCLPL
ncbi:MAG: hypothetical protein ACTJH7_10910 [Alcaligenes sp.]